MIWKYIGSDIKVEINQDNKVIYLQTLGVMYDTLMKTRDQGKWYDIFMMDYLMKLINKIEGTKVINGKKRITINPADQILISVSFAFVPELPAKMIMHQIGSGIHPVLTHFATHYFNELQNRKKSVH